MLVFSLEIDRTRAFDVGYDPAFDRLNDSEKREVRTTLLRIGDEYYMGYFSTPLIAGPAFTTHHAAVEWGSFGVLALALLGDIPDADLKARFLPLARPMRGRRGDPTIFWSGCAKARSSFTREDVLC